MKENYIKPELVVAETDDELIVYEPPKTPFWQKLMIYCIIWLVLIFGACYLTLSIVAQYEASLPQTAINSYISQAKHEIFFDAISTAIPNHDNRHEPTYSTAGRISDLYTSPLTYVKLANEYTEENPVYVIRHNGDNMFKVTLERGESTGFWGFEGYRVQKNELINDSVLNFKSYCVVFSSSSYVFINERKLQSQITGVYEMFDIFGTDGYYGIVLKDMLMEPKVMAQKYDYMSFLTTSIPVQRVDNYFMFPYNGQFNTYTITAPETALVAIDGKLVSDFFISETKEIDGVSMKVYTVRTVWGTPPVRAQYNGKEVQVLQNGNEFTVHP
ncbi:MAG: hypothetical protein E7598_05250 [Ruminococcaceae bacterium]|nr:hypothetical protein [Oscillospiraceae bacterium]